MPTLDEIRPFISIEVQGCPNPVIDAATALTVRDFLRRTESWRQTIVADWASPVDLGAVAIVRVLRIYDRLNECEVKFYTDEQLRDHEMAWLEPGSDPQAWTLDDEATPRIHPAPAAGGEASRTVDRLDVLVSRNVSGTTFDLPQALWDRYEDALRSGALSRLMKIPKRDWTDVQRAGAYGVAYEAAVAQATSRAAAGFGRPTRVVRYGGY